MNYKKFVAALLSALVVLACFVGCGTKIESVQEINTEYYTMGQFAASKIYPNKNKDYELNQAYRKWMIVVEKDVSVSGVTFTVVADKDYEETLTMEVVVTRYNGETQRVEETFRQQQNVVFSEPITVDFKEPVQYGDIPKDKIAACGVEISFSVDGKDNQTILFRVENLQLIK